MRTIRLLALGLMLAACAPAGPVSDLPEQVIGPENHVLVLDGVS
jgi:hypothetical protein